jgi:cytochrome c oxidase assembly factor CtaG
MASGRRYALLTGVAIVLAVELPFVAGWAHRSLVGHMVQHLAHTDIVPPLLFFGMPRLTRPFRALPAPLALLGSLALIWSIHFGPLFELSLENGLANALVQTLFLVAGLLLWAPVFDPERLSHATRLGYVFLAMPLTGFLGFVMYASRLPLYAQYVKTCGAGALADQQAGGELMWVGGSGIMFAGFMLLAFEYARHEARIARASESGSS